MNNEEAEAQEQPAEKRRRTQGREESERQERTQRAQEALRARMDRRREEGVAGGEGEEARGVERDETEEIRARAEAAEAEITLEMEEAMGEAFEARCASHGVGEESAAYKVLRIEYVQEARRRIARAQEDSEEARGVASKKPPGAPSAEEWRQHRLTHWPYRSWCPVCVAARAVEDAHRLRGPPAEADGPEVHWDYCFLRNRPGETTVPVLVGKDRKTRCFVAHVVPGKGAKSDWIAVQLARDLRKMGYFGRVVLRSD